MKKLITAIGATLGAAALIVIVCLLIAYPVMWVWNYVIPDVFNLPRLTITQALALLILCQVLFNNHTSKSDSK